MKPFLALLALMVVVPGKMSAQASTSPSAENAVVKVVQEFFDALQAKDADRLRAICQPGAQFTSGRPSHDGFTVRQRTLEADVAQIAESKEALLERMWAPTVHVAGRIAVVWTRYDFHRNGKISHNGTDCFTLFKTDQGWKIVNCAYSVEPSEHTENPAGPPR